MANGDTVYLMQAQLNKASGEVRNLARRFGVNYALWPLVRDTMERRQLDIIELAEFLAKGEVRETWDLFGIMRHRVESDDPADRIAGVTLSVHQDIVTIEIISLRIKE